ncbi:hypothetical protein CEXT_577651 [Caerostris extrusa]|uniref:Uncharacterized protein n=1 Tax=Caerostris extrusa TaxID=172846 RepID=A0AAV4X0X4_CAEEX|nr:hypothetical protein CEXT_577651 [Caerostris extrusa]
MACSSPFQNLHQISTREKKNKDSDTILSFTTTNYNNDYSPKPEKYAAVEKMSLCNSGGAKNFLILNPNDAEKSEKMDEKIKKKLDECLNMIVSDNESSLNSDKRKGRNKDEVLEYMEKKIKKKGHKYKIDMAYNSYFQNLHQSSAREKNKESDTAFDSSIVNSHDYYFQETENREKIRKVCFSDSSNCEAENILFSNSKDFGELAEKVHEMIKVKSLNHLANEKNNDSSLNSGGNKSENKVEGPELKEEKAKEKYKIYKVHVDNNNSFQNLHLNSTNDSNTNSSFQNLHQNSTNDSDTDNSFQNLHENSTNDNSFQNFHQNITNGSDSAFLSSAINFNNYYFKKLEKRGAIEMSCPDSNNCEAKNILLSNSHDSILEKMYKKVKYRSEKFLRHQVNENKCDTVLTSYKDKPLALLDKREKRQCKYKTHTAQNDLFQSLFENSDEEKINDSDIVFHFSTIKSQENEHKPENSQAIKDVSCPYFNNFKSGESAVELEKNQT